LVGCTEHRYSPGHLQHKAASAKNKRWYGLPMVTDTSPPIGDLLSRHTIEQYTACRYAGVSVACDAGLEYRWCSRSGQTCKCSHSHTERVCCQCRHVVSQQQTCAACTAGVKAQRFGRPGSACQSASKAHAAAKGQSKVVCAQAAVQPLSCWTRNEADSSKASMIEALLQFMLFACQ
jgi:hypothetical protein